MINDRPVKSASVTNVWLISLLLGVNFEGHGFHGRLEVAGTNRKI
jgi:hypothetical protein